MRKLKVFGGNTFCDKGQRRHFVAAYTKKQAVEILKSLYPSFSMYYFRDYWCETDNSKELAAANAAGIVCIWDGDFGLDSSPIIRIK